MKRRDFNRTLAGAAVGATLTSAAPLLHSAAGAPGDEDAEAPFKLSVMLWTVFRDLPFEQRLEKIAEAGYRSVELVTEFENWTGEDYRKAISKKQSLGMTFDTLLANANYRTRKVTLVNPADREGFLADVRSALKVAEKIECPTMIVMSGNAVPGLTREAQHQSIVEGLKRAAGIVEGKGVTLLLENIDLEENSKYYLWSVPEGFEIIGEVNHPQVKFLYDFYHAQISGGNLIANLEKHVDKVGCVHIADVPGRHEPGTGEINYENIFKVLGQLGYEHYAAMEYLPTYDPVRSLRGEREKALRAARG